MDLAPGVLVLAVSHRVDQCFSQRLDGIFVEPHTVQPDNFTGWRVLRSIKTMARSTAMGIGPRMSSWSRGSPSASAPRYASARMRHCGKNRQRGLSRAAQSQRRWRNVHQSLNLARSNRAATSAG